MKEIYIRCPKCDRVLKRKKETWNEFPYCYHCNKRYDVLIHSNEMLITIKEHDDETVRV